MQWSDHFFAVILRRMSDQEQPLVLRLLWGGADIRHNFSLQENETGDIVVSGNWRLFVVSFKGLWWKVCRTSFFLYLGFAFVKVYFLICVYVLFPSGKFSVHLNFKTLWKYWTKKRRNIYYRSVFWLLLKM